ncbi:MAG: DUF2752 domain-containing protein [Holophagaceae bacterium]|nr:DUF2752 domain-containing protein [Holophagaceae bacterium]
MFFSIPRRADGKLRFPDGAVFLSLISLAILATSFLLPAAGFPGIDTCSFHAFTGLSCPGCGLTRAFCAISHGQFHEAWGLHPFSFPLYGAAMVGAAAPWLNRRFPALTGRKAAMTFRVGVITLATAMLFYGGWRVKAEFEASRVQSNSGIPPARVVVEDRTSWCAWTHSS